jgi:uncharacterized protein YqeY
MDKTQLQAQIVSAMKAKDKNRLAALRQVMQSVKNGEIARGHEATESEVTTAIKKNLKEAKEELDALLTAPDGRESRIAAIKGQAQALESLLPAQLSGNALAQEVERAIAEVGATTRRDTGKVMGWLTKETDGNFDKPAAAKLIGAALA